MSEHVSSFEEELAKNGQLVYRNRGNSMLPMLRQDRDVIVLEPRKTARCRKYDVVLYKREDRYILHRILKVTPDGYVICGDHNIKKEYDITDGDILGILTSFIRNGREISAEDRGYRIYAHVWCGLYPVRAMERKTRRTLGRVRRKLKNLR